MTYPSYYSRREKFGLWLGERPLVVRALFFGVVFFIVQFLVLLVIGASGNPDGSAAGRLLTTALSSLFTALLITIVLVISIPYGLRRFNRIVGVDTTTRERVDLVAWLRTGIRPESGRLTPALPKYLDYLEPIAAGRRLAGFGNRTVRTVFFVFYILITLSFVAILIADPESRGHWIYYFDIVLFGYLTYVLNPWSKGKRLYMRLNRRVLRWIAVRRKELESDAVAS